MRDLTSLYWHGKFTQRKNKKVCPTNSMVNVRAILGGGHHNSDRTLSQHRAEDESEGGEHLKRKTQEGPSKEGVRRGGDCNRVGSRAGSRKEKDGGGKRKRHSKRLS